MANYMKQRAAFISAGFQAGLQAGRQQILDMMSLVLRDPKYVKKDIHGAERLLTIVKGIGDYIDIYQDAWQKTDETDYVRAKLDAALADAYGPGLHDSFTQRYDTAPEYDYTKGKWKK
jgi:hypothetical protein